MPWFSGFSSSSVASSSEQLVPLIRRKGDEEWVGREGGYHLLRRYGRYIRLDERKVKLGQYLFRKHGGKVVFFGRFIAVLRTWAAFLAGANCMPWRSFLLFNALGGIIWATVYGLGGLLP